MIEIDLAEAKRRTESMLVHQGYKVTGQWAAVSYEDEKEPIWSRALVGFVNTRVLLYRGEKDHWRSVISVKVGKRGEFPICSGFISRKKKDKFMPPASKMDEKIQETLGRIYRWDTSPANTYSAQAIARLTEVFLKKKASRKARVSNSMIINGTINAATISEALSIVQSLVAKSREDRLDSALIWGEVYR